MFPAIPNYTALRSTKPGYDARYPIDTEHPLHDDPLVDPRDEEFGSIEGSSYYARPNRMTGEVLPGVPDAPLVRQDLALRLMQVQRFLMEEGSVVKALGAPARLRIDDALRPYEVQLFAYEFAWPKIIRKVNPDLSEEEVMAERDNYIAAPKKGKTPTPHLTAGAVDVALINANTGEPFDRGHVAGKVKGSAYPDFHEGYHLTEGQSDISNEEGQTEVAREDSEVVQGRRVLHYAMTVIGGLFINPQEIWHFGIGDPLSAHVHGSMQPYYGIAKLPGWYTAEMAELKG